MTKPILLGQPLCNHCLDAEKANLDLGSPAKIAVIREGRSDGFGVVANKSLVGASMPLLVEHSDRNIVFGEVAHGYENAREYLSAMADWKSEVEKALSEDVEELTWKHRKN